MTPSALTAAQVANLLQLSCQSVYRLISKGLLPRIPGIRVIRVPQGALNEYLAGRDGLAVRVSSKKGKVQQARIPHQGCGTGGNGGAPARDKGAPAADPNRHGLLGGYE